MGRTGSNGNECCNAMEWNGMRWDGMGWDATPCYPDANATQFHAVERNASPFASISSIPPRILNIFMGQWRKTLCCRTMYPHGTQHHVVQRGALTLNFVSSSSPPVFRLYPGVSGGIFFSCRRPIETTRNDTQGGWRCAHHVLPLSPCCA